ncbi:MAG: MFS transporter [Gammaproteobacteria bacterium]
MKTDSYFNVVVLAVANAFAFASIPLLLFIASFVGIQLAPTPDLATVPIAMSVIGLAIGILPVSKVTARFGRKISFFLFLWFGVVACLLASVGVEQKSFNLFLVASFLFGISSASIQQFRYAAIECLGREKAATAASIILSGGIVAAFLGPELAIIGKDFTLAEYQGSFWLSALSLALASVFILIFKAAVFKDEDNPLSARPFREMINPGLFLAICSGAVSYFVMTLIMTATPLSMHHHFMHSLEDTKFVIQSHIVAMFLPSLISPFLFRLFGMLNMMKIGLGIYGLTIVTGFFLTSVFGFWVQLVLLGIGWNFLFVAGTAMLANHYRPEDRLKAQAINDSLIFSLQAIASISAGILMARVNWADLVFIGFVPVMLMLGVMFWYYQVKPKKILEPK